MSETTNEPLIKQIQRDVVHRICSGQVVLSLGIAVKELVENAIDASAKIIEIRLKDFGSQLIEVVDNGSGVRQEDFAVLTLKHYTSKLRSFEELVHISTMGFRGEALSSLCALAAVTVTTRHESAQHATRIQYDSNGKITDEAPTARAVGTTVSVTDLFATLPVRRREFMKNLKREYTKMCQLLYAYCLVSKGIKFTCTNQTPAGKKTTVINTTGTTSVKDAIIALFGAKQISSLIDIETVPPSKEILEEFNLKSAEGIFTLDCLISSGMQGAGRASSDRQFYYVNGRPCEPLRVSRLVNEMYRQCNTNGQYPFVYMDIRTSKAVIDVNVTPDKRQLFIEQESLMLATVKSSLQTAFKDFPSTFKLQNMDLTTSFLNTSNEQFHEESVTTSKGIKRSNTNVESRLDQFKLQPMFKRSKSDTSPQENTIKRTAIKSKELKSTNLLEMFGKKTTKIDNWNENKKKTMLDLLDSDEVESPSCSKLNATVHNEQIVCTYKSNKKFDEACHDVQKDISTILEESGVDVTRVLSQPTDIMQYRNKVKIQTNLDWIRKKIKENRTQASAPTNQVTSVKFRSEITPKENDKAEMELQRQISKDMFAKMQIVGQFNLGFVITRLENDLFIVDQHATDEKYNFEQLQLNTILESQNLVIPKPLELSSAYEETLLDHRELFKKNGFSFIVDDQQAATKKIKLATIPISKNYVFGNDDIDEMLFLLQNGANPMTCRPSRVRSMFASRACRKSVMIGKSLSKSDMRKLVNHMGEIDQPWNCPHGRPTMRHLINLRLLSKNIDKFEN